MSDKLIVAHFLRLASNYCFETISISNWSGM
jgi:hypothetical protein